MLVAVNCPECQGTGRNGTLGYALLCGTCGGDGNQVIPYATSLGEADEEIR
jgi:DnaJ-class molecular chaperone